MKLTELPLFFLDIQTTGAKPGAANILEIAWQAAEDSRENYLVAQPDGRRIPYAIQNITGIRDVDLEGALPLGEVTQRLQTFSGTHPWAIIHFAQFEKPFLHDAFAQANQEVPFQILCTHEIAKRLLPNLPTRGIKGLAGYFGYRCTDIKRAVGHIEATQFIWTGLVELLRQKDISTLEELQNWMQDTPKTARTKYEYPLPKEKRLNLPDQPGIYRMISRWGEVLYVGKATSLKDRVNSYFRGQKNRDPRKLEMLTQVYDLIVTPCGSPLEAALMETDEIKRLDPRYNISLKTGQRSMVFFDRTFESMSFNQDDEHTIGPFSNALVLDSMRRLVQSLHSENFDEQMFFEPIDAELIKEGYQVFCERHDFDLLQFNSLRSILAVGLWWSRHEDLETEIDEDVLDQEEAVEETEIELTAEDIADKFERHFMRAARAYQRARHMTKLLNADIDFRLLPDQPWSHLIIRQGQIGGDLAASPPPEISKPAWQNMKIETYDRMTVLASELEKIQSQSGEVQISRPTPPSL